MVVNTEPTGAGAFSGLYGCQGHEKTPEDARNKQASATVSGQDGGLRHPLQGQRRSNVGGLQRRKLRARRRTLVWMHYGASRRNAGLMAGI